MADYRQWLSEFSDWLKDVNDHEVKDMVATFLESKQALKDLSKDKYEEYKRLFGSGYRPPYRARELLQLIGLAGA